MCDVFGIIGAVTGISGLIISLSNHFLQARYGAISQFLTELGGKELIEARKHVYNTASDAIGIDDEKASPIVNFYHKWGTMAEHRLLPIWVFNKANQNGMIRLYKQLSHFMKIMREKNKDDLYASGFEYLYKKLSDKAKRGKAFKGLLKRYF